VRVAFVDSFLAGALSFEVVVVVVSFVFDAPESGEDSAFGDEDSESEALLSEAEAPDLAFFESRLSVL
jgi:hypothetical protein